MKVWIEENLFTVKRDVNWKKVEKLDDQHLSIILSYPGRDIREKLYNCYNNIHEIPLCKNCRKECL